MGKKKLIIIVASILIVVGIGVGVGLGIELNSRIKYKAYFYNDSFDWRDMDVHEGCFELATSLDELKEICATYEIPAYSEEHFAYLNPICLKIREFDEAYFAEKAVIIISGADRIDRYRINKIYVKNQELVVDLHYEEYRGGHGLMLEYTTIIIEINKADITGVTDIKLK